MTDTRWLRDAACRDTPGFWWVKLNGEPGGDAEACCRACSVRDACLVDALRIEGRVGTSVGYRAGLTSKQRQELLHARYSAR